LLNIDCPYSIGSITLYDYNGKTIYHTLENRNIINVSAISKGIYILKVETDKASLIEKVVIE